MLASHPHPRRRTRRHEQNRNVASFTGFVKLAILCIAGVTNAVKLGEREAPWMFRL